jgi:NAD(P)H-hydrate epimerase
MNHRFITETGLEIPGASSEQMKEIDRIAMEETGPNLYQMMENAGRNLTLFITELLGSEWQNRTILILAGSGGNGGGGICAARHLANHSGNVVLCAPPSNMLGHIALFQHKIFTATPGREVSPDKLPEIGAEVIVDAIIGYGLKSAPHGMAAELIEWTNNTKRLVVSLDIPSGVDAIEFFDIRGRFYFIDSFYPGHIATFLSYFIIQATSLKDKNREILLIFPLEHILYGQVIPEIFAVIHPVYILVFINQEVCREYRFFVHRSYIEKTIRQYPYHFKRFQQ